MKLRRRYMRGYKKNTLSLLTAMVLTIALFTSLFILFHTNHRIAAKQNQFIFTAYDYQISDVSQDQISELKEVKGIQHLGISRNSAIIHADNKQKVTLLEANRDSILAVSKLVKGRMPTAPNEIVVERWAMLNLGIEPQINELITFNVGYVENDVVYETREVSFKVVGIIKDMAFNKRAGLITLYTGISDKKSSDYTLTIKWENSNDKEKSMQKMADRIEVDSKQITGNVWSENSKQLLKWDIEMGVIIGGIFIIILYGVFRVFFISRESQYGVLRAIGAKRIQIRNLILGELLEIYILSVPFGVCAGVLGAYLITGISKQRKIDVYFWGTKEPFKLVFPFPQLIIGILLMGGIVIMISSVFAHKLNQESIINIIRKSSENHFHKIRYWVTIKGKNRISVDKILGLRYLNINFSSTLFLILSFTVGCSFFFGLGYQATLAKSDNQIGKELNFYNSDYIITSNDDMRPNVGITEETLQSIKKLGGVKSIETQKAMPIKVFDKGIAKNREFLANGEELVKKNYGFSLVNSYDNNSIYLTKLKGYSENVLRNLKKYTVEGNVEPANMKQNEVIIVMPRLITQGQSKGTVGFFKEGLPIMDYKIGDNVKIAYPKSLNTDTMEYWQCKDNLKDYNLKELKVSAIVYFPYMKTMSPLEQNYPLFIVSDEQYNSWIPLNTYESINIELNSTAYTKAEIIEIQLIELAVKNQQVTARSIIEERKNLDEIYHKQLVYIYGISVVTLVLILINLINNLQYRIQIRKNEFAIYKALGMKKRVVYHLVCFEHRLICILSIFFSFGLTTFMSPILFERSQLSLYGIVYKYNYLLFVIVSAVCIFICEIVTRRIVATQDKGSVISVINRVE